MSTERYVEGCALVLRAVRAASGDRRRIRFDVVTSEQPEKMDIERAWREGLAARNVGGVDLVLRFGGDVFEAFHVLVDADVLLFAQSGCALAAAYLSVGVMVKLKSHGQVASSYVNWRAAGCPPERAPRDLAGAGNATLLVLPLWIGLENATGACGAALRAARDATLTLVPCRTAAYLRWRDGAAWPTARAFSQGEGGTVW